MRLGFSIAGTRPAARAVEAAVAAERAGFEEVWVTEDYCERGAFSVAAGIAAATEIVRVGLGVLNPWTRHPVLTAMEFAALDELAGERAVLGMGASNVRWMEVELGIPFRRPLAVLRESVEVLRATLAGEHLDHRGEAFRVATGLSFTPPCTDVPIWLGVKGPKALDLAGEVSDGVLLSVLSSPAYTVWAIERLEGRVPVAAYVEFACSEDSGEAKDAVRPTVARFLGVHGEHAITRTAGLEPELARAFREGWVAGEPRLDLADDRLVDTFAVAGDPEECAAGFARFREAGLDTLVVRDHGGPDVEGLLADARAAWERAG